MRNIFPEFILKELKNKKNIKILLGDIGVHGFREVFKKYKKNILNFGVMEQTMMSFAAGIALEKQIPFVHTIAPFLVNRAFEQIKIDACYQNLNINIVSVGASIDYASLGPTHHCPEDIGILNSIPNIKIFIPGNENEFKQALSEYKKNYPKYFRMTNKYHSLKFNIQDNVKLLQKGEKGLIIVFGPALRFIENYYSQLDANIVYINKIDTNNLKLIKKYYKKKIILLQDFYVESLTGFVLKNFYLKPVIIKEIGLPKVFFDKNGTSDENYKHYNLTQNKVKKQIKNFFD